MNQESGMSLRAYFAGRAMQGILANPGSSGPIQLVKDDLVMCSVTIADAMIAELNKPVEEESHE
jgi:hypothetical protein